MYNVLVAKGLYIRCLGEFLGFIRGFVLGWQNSLSLSRYLKLQETPLGSNLKNSHKSGPPDKERGAGAGRGPLQFLF